ncbi:hypothetical protein [Halorubellus sp. PRR65]|uniref:hypothetical protein n=1 Tax=Halorubellus sp. PRR65 TaxID=3098148 RepID=UPI002B263F61|nr:hypothetical protein [Halorubellus sp. PRR65]
MDDAADAGGFEWECEHCGERTPKHNPPCSNCGGMSLEKVPLDGEREVREAESLAGTSRRTVIGYGVAGAAAVVGGGYFIWDALTPPTIPDAPGNAERAGGISLAAVEDEVLAGVNAERDTALAAEGRVVEAARYATAYTVVEGESGSARELYGRLDEFRIGRYQFVRRILSGGESERAIEGFADADAVADAFLRNLLGDDDVRAFLTNERFEYGSADVHVAPNGDAYASVVVASGGTGVL